MRSVFAAVVASMLCACASQAAKARADWLVPAGKAVTALKETGEGDQRRIIIENGFLRAVINPAQGARIESLVHKASGQELTMPLQETVPGGLLSDGIWQQDYWRGDWLRAPYTVSIMAQGPDEVKVALSRSARTWTGLSIMKTVTLRKGSSTLTAEYVFSADKNTPAKCRPDQYFPQALGGRGHFFLPTESGVITRPESTESESWCWDPTRPWLGFIGDNGTGLVATFDATRLRAYRVSQTPAMTMECIYRKTEMTPGKVVRSAMTLTPFAGIDRIDGASDWLAAGLSASAPRDGKAEVRMAFAPFEDARSTVSFALRPMSGGAPTTLDQRTLTLKADERQEIKFTAAIPAGQNVVLEATVRAQDKPDVALEQPVFQAGGKGAYAMAPAAGRVPEVNDVPSWARYHAWDFDFNSTATSTPHRDWAKPYAGGRPRVLMLCADGMDREAVELAQRFDMDIHTHFICANTYYMLGDGVRGLPLQTVTASLDKTLAQNWDVIFFSIVGAWPQLTDKQKARIIELANAGTGLVFTQRGDVPKELKELVPLQFGVYDAANGHFSVPSNAGPTLRGLPYEALPLIFYSCSSKLRKNADGSPMGQVLLETTWPGTGHANYPLVAAGEIGKGRVVECMTEGIVIPGYNKWANVHIKNERMPAFDYWEYQYAMMARLIYWAARKESPVTLSNVRCEPGKVSVSLISDAEGPATLNVTLRDYFGEVLKEIATPVDLKKAPLVLAQVDVPADLSTAPYLADVSLANDKGVLAFGGGSFAPGKVHFAKLTADKPIFEFTENVALTAKIDGAVPANATIQASLYDGLGRQLSTTSVPAAAETKVGLLSPAIAYGPWYKARLKLIVDGKAVDQISCEGNLKAVRHPERYRALLWTGMGGGRPENVGRAFYELLRSLGMNADWQQEGSVAVDSRYLRQLNMAYTRGSGTGMSTNSGVTKEQAAKAPVEKGNIVADPASYEDCRKRGAAAGKGAADDDVLLYSCGDENRGQVKDIDFSEQGKAAFRKYLQEREYKTIADLNKEWGTQYKSFEEVVALTEAEAKESAKTTKTYAPWLDQRNWFTWANANLARAIVEGVHSTDPQGLVGESGSEEAYVYGTGRDWWHMSRAYDALAAYGGAQAVEQESYNPKLVRYSWVGYGKPNPMTRDSLYRILGSYDRGVAIFAGNSHIDPDWTLSEPGRDLRAATIELQHGIGQMMVSAQDVQSPVFILQSQSSLLGAYIIGDEKRAARSRAAVMPMLLDLGLRFQNISYEQLATGELPKKDCRVLMLPYAVALSDAEVSAIREWVRNGGVLVADLRTAMMNAHGRMRAKPELDDVFGIDRSAAEIIEAKKGEEWKAGPKGAQFGTAISAVEKGITGSATPLWMAKTAAGEYPIVFANNFGNGRAYYFAADICGAYDDADGAYKDATVLQRITTLQQILEQAMADAKVKPLVDVRLRDAQTGQPGLRSPWLVLRVKQAGAAQFVLIQRDYDSAQGELPDTPALIQFAKAGAIYDVLNGQYLGQGDNLPITLMNATNRIFAVLPAPVTGVKVEGAKSTYAPGETATMTCRVEAAQGANDPRVFRLEVIAPDGSPSMAYSDDVIADDAQGKIRIPFALNDSLGDWKLHVRDVASGATADLSLKLQR